MFVEINLGLAVGLSVLLIRRRLPAFIKSAAAFSRFISSTPGALVSLNSNAHKPFANFKTKSIS